MNYYEKNMKFLEEKNFLLAVALKEWEKKSEENVDAEEGLYEFPVIQCERGGKKLFLSSPYDGEGTYEKKWLKQFDQMTYEGYLLYFGMAKISYVEKICQEKEDFFQFMYEPSVEVFRAMMEWTDLTFMGEKVALVVKDLNDSDLQAYLFRVATADHLQNMKYLCMPNYDKLFPEEYKDFMALTKKVATGRLIDEQTIIRFSEELTRNRRNNLMYVVRSRDLQYVRENYPKGKPGIVVSAGPSLNNNIDELKNAVGKAFIVATDTALKPLLNHGICPDAFSTVDPSKPLILFDREEVWGIPMVIPEDGNSEVVERHYGPIFFTNTDGDFGGTYYDEFEKPRQWLESGGSVANDAFSMAKEIGCNPIILVGQDLAYTNKRSHADGTFQDKMQEISTEGGRYLDVEGIDGKPVRTSIDFKIYLDWFEEQIKKYSEEVQVIDATEGGAKIHGAELMTLKDAIDTYCKESFPTGEVFEKAPELFSEEERKEIDSRLLKMAKQLDKIKKLAQRGKGEYETLYFRARRGELKKEFKSAMKKVTKIVEQLEENEVMRLISPYLADYDYIWKNDMRKVDLNTMDGLKELLEGGKAYMEKLEKTVEILKDDFKEMEKKLKTLQKKETKKEEESQKSEE